MSVDSGADLEPCGLSASAETTRARQVPGKNPLIQPGGARCVTGHARARRAVPPIWPVVPPGAVLPAAESRASVCRLQDVAEAVSLAGVRGGVACLWAGAGVGGRRGGCGASGVSAVGA